MQPGIHLNLPERDYFALPYASKSTLMYLLKSPKHLRRALDGFAKTKTESMAFGTAVDAAVFAPAEFDQRVAVKPECDRRTKDGKAIYEAFLATAGGKVVIDREQAASIPNILRDLNAHPVAGRLLAPRVAGAGDGFLSGQVSLVWDDIIRCRARLDGVSVMDGETIVWDLKTCADIEQISADALKFGYPIQAAMYRRGLGKLDELKGRERKSRRFLFVFVQSEPDEITGEHPVATLEYSGDDLDKVDAIVDGLLFKWQDCEEKNQWPSPIYTPRSEVIPEWWLTKYGQPEIDHV